MSGCASDMAGIDWLQALLGERYRVLPVALRSNVLHLDCALGLVKPDIAPTVERALEVMAAQGGTHGHGSDASDSHEHEHEP